MLRHLLILACVLAPLSGHAIVKVTTPRGTGDFMDVAITHLSTMRGTWEPFLAVRGKDPAGRCLISVETAKKSGLTLDGIFQIAIQGINSIGIVEITCSEMTSDEAGKVKIRYSSR